MAEALPLEFMNDDSLAGFRLQRLEVYNWGTFHGRVWTLRPNGKNCLLTGEIGSGKSTLLDAVTTLLVPGQRIVYNRAAGAETRERTLRSYVQGFYKSERQESLGGAKPVPLRDHNSYSVLLAVFGNAGFKKFITLAQVFWIRDQSGPPAHFYAACDRDLSISADFSGFGSDMAALRKQLRSRAVEVFDSFPPYGSWFCRRFGIGNAQALELFNQTISLKSVGNLTDFVRDHMLAPFDAAARIDALLEHYDNLNHAHEAVLKAKRQIGMLEPLVRDWEAHGEVERQTGALQLAVRCLPPFFARLKLELLDRRLTEAATVLQQHNAEIDRLEEARHALEEKGHELRRAIAESGGNRIEELKAAIDRETAELAARKLRAKGWAALLHDLEMAVPESEAAFLDQRAQLAACLEAAKTDEAAAQNELTEQTVALREARAAHDQVRAEIAGLKRRASNIDEKQVALRRGLCGDLGIPESGLPFAGELLRVREEERDWEGALERLLHGFGLSLLIPDAHYARVAAWVDRTHLAGRLVYYRVREGAPTRQVPSAPEADSAVRKLAIRPDTPFLPWLEQELTRRFDLICCADQDRFRRESRAITQAGQIKLPGEHHEKDDRHRIDDRRRYILGWTNEEKIAALEQEARERKTRIGDLEDRVTALQRGLTALRERRETLAKLETYASFRDLDWRTVARNIADREEELGRLTAAASDRLKVLEERLTALTNERRAADRRLDELKDRRGQLARDIRVCEKARAEAVARTAAGDAEHASGPPAAAFAGLEGRLNAATGGDAPVLERCEVLERSLRDQLLAEIAGLDNRRQDLANSIVRAMVGYKKEWPLETGEVDAHTAAGPEYRSMLERLRADDLPRFEARFKELLNENTIREIAGFQAQLDGERRQIQERIASINVSLGQIDYNPGRYIRLEERRNPDREIADFQAELRACTENALTGSDDAQYSEAKFLQVRRIIERFRGREGHADLDRRWTARVTDVRNWFTFAASERWREDDAEYEHYADSGGKSGGQKEKLAYTVLAASLAYQFGLEWGAVHSRTFRFVVIDEAFGRGSDESTHYALQLFERLNLQLLMATPLQKIAVIEPYIATIGYVQGKDGQESLLRNLSIEEYRAQRQESQA